MIHPLLIVWLRGIGVLESVKFFSLTFDSIDKIKSKSLKTDQGDELCLV